MKRAMIAKANNWEDFASLAQSVKSTRIHRRGLVPPAKFQVVIACRHAYAHSVVCCVILGSHAWALAFISDTLLSVAEKHKVTTINITFVYRSCTWHSDCGTNQFCGVKCWTGGCDETKENSKGKKAKKHGGFCQPCTKCQKYSDSSTRSCATCQVSGSKYMSPRI